MRQTSQNDGRCMSVLGKHMKFKKKKKKRNGMM